MAGKRVQLLKPLPLAVFLVALGVALYLVFPHRGAIEKIRSSGERDRAATEYLRLWVETRPEERGLRFVLAKQLVALGERREAVRALAPLVDKEGEHFLEAALMSADLLAALLEETGEEREEVFKTRQKLRSVLHKLPVESLGPERLDRMARHAIGVKDAVAAEKLLSALARSAEWSAAVRWRVLDGAAALLREGMSEEAYRVLAIAVERDPGDQEMAALAFRAAGTHDDPGTARDRRLKILSMVPDDPRLMDFKIGASLRGRLHDETFRLLELAARRDPENRPLVIMAMEEAAAGEKPETVKERRERIFALIPRTPGTARTRLDVALRYGMLKEAYNAANSLVEQNPGDRWARERLAEISRWIEKPREALEHYAWLAARGGEEDNVETMLALGRWFTDWETIARTLDAVAEIRTLSKEELGALGAAWENTGEAEKAAGALSAYIRRYPGERGAREVLASVLKHMGSLERALSVWEGIEERFGASAVTAAKRAELLWRMNRPGEAFGLLKNVDEEIKTGERYWALTAELSWIFEDNEQAARAYSELLALRPDDLNAMNRLVFIKREQGDHWKAIALGKEFWRKTSKPRFLLGAMNTANEISANDDLEKMLEEAVRHEEMFASSELYWILKASALKRKGRYDEALASHKRAIEVNPYSSRARRAMLSFLVETEDTARLREYLARWRRDASIDPSLWKLYASGYQLLGEADEALRWRWLYARRHFDDYFWLLSLAEDMDKAGMQEEAHRLREFVAFRMREKVPTALSDLSRTENRETAKAFAYLVNTLHSARLGEQVTSFILAHSEKDDDLDNFAVTWFLGHDRFDTARVWIKDRSIPRDRVPDWQRFVLALQGADLPELGRVYETGEDISLFDRVEADRLMARQGMAIRVARKAFLDTPHSWRNEPLLSQTAGLSAEQAPKASAAAESETLGELRLAKREAVAQRSRGDAIQTLTVKDTTLSADRKEMNLEGENEEREISFSAYRRLKRTSVRAQLGVNTRNGDSLPKAKLWGQYVFVERLRGEAAVSVNEVSSESPALRAAGLKDSVDLYLFNDITRWDYALARLTLHRYHDREGGRIGEGMTADVGVGTRLKRENPELALRLHGFATRNSLAARLPEYAAAILPDGYPIESVVPADFYSIGFGVSARKGDPGAVSAANGTMSYLLDVYFGMSWPSEAAFYSLRGSVGVKILGDDELSLSVWRSNNTNGIVDEPYQGIGLRYTYRFGG
ncbi:MAG: tetratricopeptide repeat protein [Candidatus Nitrospinota bacterium M3_3B_026]